MNTVIIQYCGKKFDGLTFENKEIKTVAIQFPPNFNIVLPHAHKWPFWWHLNKIKSLFLINTFQYWINLNEIQFQLRLNETYYIYIVYIYIYMHI